MLRVGLGSSGVGLGFELVLLVRHFGLKTEEELLSLWCGNSEEEKVDDVILMVSEGYPMVFGKISLNCSRRSCAYGF